MTLNSSEQLQMPHTQTRLEHLPVDILANILHRLHTVTIMACQAAHPAFAQLIDSVHFRNSHTRYVLGFPANQRDITYETVPAPVAPLQDLWFQEYLHRAAPHLLMVVRPGVVFYDLACFRHLLDTWLLQGLRYTHRKFASDVLKESAPPPLSFLQCGRSGMLQPDFCRMLTKVALCCPDVLLLTVNNFEAFSITPSAPLHLDDAWERSIPPQWQAEEPGPQHTCEVVSCQRGLALASFFFTFNLNHFVTWCGIIDYSTFRCKGTWSFCKFSTELPLGEIQELSDNLFHRFRGYLDHEFISPHCPSAFLFPGLMKMMRQRDAPIRQLQNSLENHSISIGRKLRKTQTAEENRKLCAFLDSTELLEPDRDPSANYYKRLKARGTSKTLEVAVQRFLHRYLNLVVGRWVLPLYMDVAGHQLLCLSTPRGRCPNPPAFCAYSQGVGPQHLPLRLWPPHLLHIAMEALPALATLVRLDTQLWRRGFLTLPLPPRVQAFIAHTLSQIHLHLHLNPTMPGCIARRLTM